MLITASVLTQLILPSTVLAQEDLGISAQAYVLIEAKSGTVIAASNEHEQLAMASTTKIMTALLTLEQDNQDAYFTVDNDAILVEGSSMGLLADDQVSFSTLAVGMLLASGNDAANVAATEIGGDIDNFVDIMNERASEIGMSNTNFVNPSGLYDEEHYSSAYDMAMLTRVALDNRDFKEICSSEKMTIEYGNPPYTRTLSNHNKMLSMYEGAIGVKTGFTKLAGRCLVSAAERDGVTLICVTLNAPNDWNDHTRLLDYGFAGVKKVDVSSIFPQIEIDVVGGSNEKVSVLSSDDSQIILLNEQDPSQITTKIICDNFIYAPISSNQKLGIVEYYIADSLVFTSDLVASESISYYEIPQEEISFFAKLYNMIFG